jgi:hypothetical protein
MRVLTSPKIAAVAIVAMLAGGWSGGVTLTKPLASARPPASDVCTTSALKGECGPYSTYRQITGTTSKTHIGNNVWNPIPGAHQTLSATNPGSWYVTATLPPRNTAVVSYPSIGANYGRVTDVPTPLTHYSSIYSSFSESMNATRGTSAWAAYDIWLGPNNCSPAQCDEQEVMIQHDFAHNGACPTLATADFGGSGGVPVQTWKLCQFGSELVWKLAGNEHSGSVNLLSMLTWLVNHQYLPANTGLWSIGYGWEICSTGGVQERFQVSGFSLTPTALPAGKHSPSSS